MYQWVGPALKWILFVAGLILFLGGAIQIIINNRKLVRVAQDWTTPTILILLALGVVYIIITK